jgi:DHA1 family bicyclomycin/chloramphenicol resistance-like MFS transporter
LGAHAGIRAFASGRIAGKVDGTTQVRIGFACCGVAVAANIAYNLLVDVPTVPWAVLPMALNSFGIALVFPILTLAILDMYPRQRGSASSLQAFTGLVSNAFVAGVLSPWLSGSGLQLALGAAVFSTLGWIFFRWELHANARMPACAPKDSAALEPTERL